MNYFGNFTPPDLSVPPPMNLMNNGMGNRMPTFRNQYPSKMMNQANMHGPMPNQQFSRLPDMPQQRPPNFQRNSNFHPPPRNQRGFGARVRPEGRPFPSNVYADDIFGTAAPTNQMNVNNFPHSNNPYQSQKIQPQQNFRGGRGFQGSKAGRNGGSRGRGQFSNNGSNQQGNQIKKGSAKKKKERVDKRDLPENNVFFCDICDRGFKTEEKYKEHVDGHIKCSYKDCPFVAAPKLVQLHVHLQHKGGLAKKIWNIESEEDIKKWREERKRNYPTAANIEKKKELQTERVKRGQILETKEFGKMRGRHNRDRGRGRGRGRGRFQRGRPWNQSSKEEEVKEEEDSDDDGPPEEIKIVRGSSNQIEEDQLEVGSQSETVEPAEGVINKEEKEVTNGTSLSLLVGYGSSEDGDSSDEETASVQDKNHNQVDHVNKDGNRADKGAILSTNDVFRLRSSTEAPHSSKELDTATSELEGCQDASLSSYEKDPFNLSSDKRNHDATSSVILHQRAARESSSSGLSIEACGNKAENLPQQQTGSEEMRKEFWDNLPIDDSAIFTDVVDLAENLPRPENSAEGGSGCSSPSKQERELKGGKRGHSSTRSKDNRREEGKKEIDYAKKKKFDHKPPVKSYTLLEKLLAPQIRRERNKILQCVYYIVKNKFFDGDSTATQER